jgi:hypothetical protein
MKNYKSNINYFMKWEGLKTLGLGMMIVGFACLWLGWGWTYLIGAALMVSGIVVFLVGNIGRSSEEEIKEEIKRRSEGIEFPEVETDRHFYKRVPAKPEILDFSGFSLSEGLLLKRMKNGSICSSEYSRARVFLLTDAFYAKTRTFSLVSDTCEEDTVEIPFASVEDVVVLRESKSLPCGKKLFAVKPCYLVIAFGGKKLYLPAADDVYGDELAARLKKLAEKEKAE